MLFTKDDLKIFMDIKDLRKSAGFLRILFFMVQQEIEIRTLKALLTTKTDSYACESAKNFVAQDPEINEMLYAINEHIKGLDKVADNPQERLRAMFKAKLEGRL